jgi:hypothetical protein
MPLLSPIMHHASRIVYVRVGLPRRSHADIAHEAGLTVVMCLSSPLRHDRTSFVVQRRITGVPPVLGVTIAW